MAKLQKAFEWRLITDQKMISKAQSAIHETENSRIRDILESDLYSFPAEDFAIQLMYKTMANMHDESSALPDNHRMAAKQAFLEATLQQVIESVARPSLDVYIIPGIYTDNYYGRKHMAVIKSQLERSGKFKFEDVVGEPGEKRAILTP